MPGEKTFHMTPEEFRRHGHAVVDWIADYYARIESFPVLSRAEPGRDPRVPAGRSAAEGRAFRRDPARRRKADPARHHALAIAEFLCLLSLQCVRARRFSATCFLPAWACRGCCGRPAPPAPNWRPMCWTGWSPCWTCREKFLSTSSGGGVIQDTASSASLCALLAARERATGLRQQSARMRRQTGRLHFDPGALVHREGGKIAGIGRDNLRADRGGRKFRHAPRRAGAADRAGPPGGPAFPASSAPPWVPLRRMRSIPCLRLAASAASTDSGCTWTPPCPARPRFARSFATSTPAWSSPTATASIPTSGCSRISTAIVFMSPTARRLIQTLSILPEYLRNQATEIGRGDRLSRLADSARPALSGAQVVVRDPALRSGRAAASHPAARRTGAAVRRLGQG